MREVTVAELCALPKSEFQPTLPVREVTTEVHMRCDFVLVFQPTLPVREVTAMAVNITPNYNISTHTSREGSDLLMISQSVPER